MGKSSFKQLIHPPYSPDLAPSDYYLFRHLKQAIRGKQFSSSAELKTTVNEWINQQTPEFFEKAFDMLPVLWEKCVLAEGGYVEK